MIQPLNILLLEDRDSDAMLIEQQLKNSEIDFRFHRATNRAEYMEAIGSFNPDIILSDENLPAYNGLLAYKDMKETGKMLPFIIVTGSLSDELTSQIITAGIDDYLLKDRLSRLPKAITNALEKKQAELERENYINELQEAQRNLLKANRLYAFTSAVNKSIVHTGTKQELLNKACTIAMEIGGFKLALIGLLDETENYLNMISMSGDQAATDEAKKHSGISYKEPVIQLSPTGQAINTGRYAVSNDMQNDPTMAAWKKEMMEQDMRSGIVFPLKKYGKVIGIFGFYSRILNFFDTKEITLLEEAVDDISFALEVMEKDQQRSKAEALLAENVAQLRKAQSIAHMGHWEMNIATGLSTWSEEARRIYGLSQERATYAAQEWLSCIYPDDLNFVKQTVKAMQETLNNSAFDHRIIRQDDQVLRYVHSEGQFELDESGKPVRLYGTVQDITREKLAEQEILQLNEELEQRVKDRTRKLAEKNKDITASIQYAQRLQNAMLPELNLLEKQFPGSFVYYEPKDTVSGDFYWFQHFANDFIVAAADCTGHGVPGAFMSMLGMEKLQKIVVEQGHKNPSLVLELMDDGLERSLSRDKHNDVKDGMDVAICRIQKNDKLIKFAGAARPCILVSKGTLQYFKGSMFSLGGIIDKATKLYDTLTIPYEQGDMLYLFSDGFADQFGGVHDKKLMVKTFKDLLLENSALPAAEQKNHLQHFFDSWKGTATQVDDVLVMGIRL